MGYKVVKMPDQNVALTGCVSVPAGDFGSKNHHFVLENIRSGAKTYYTGIPSTKISSGQVFMYDVKGVILN